MHRPALGVAAVCALVCLFACFAGAQGDRRALEAEFRLAQSSCNSRTDSGSVKDAVRRLNAIAAQNPNYPGLKQLLDGCQTSHKQLLDEEDLIYAEAKAAYDRRAYDDARNKFQSLANKNCPRAVDAKNYLALMKDQAPGSSGAAAAGITQKDYADLDLAKRNYQAKNYPQARALAEPLVGKGGNVGTEAKRILDAIDLYNKNSAMVDRGLQALRQKRGAEALQMFQAVQQSDPSYPGLAPLIQQATTLAGKSGGAATAAPPAPAVPANPDFERGKKLFAGEDYAGALKAFQAAQSAHALAPDLPGWIQKTETAIKDAKRLAQIDRLVSGGEANLRKRDFRAATVQLRQALALAPDDENVQGLLQKATTGMKQAGQEMRAEDATALLTTALQQAIGEFYAGNFGETERLLGQHTGGQGQRFALAYFYRGAARSTQFFLEGGADGKKEAQALDFFRKARQADPGFNPPADWVSPKIIALYKRATQH